MKKIRLTEEIWKEGNMYVSYCPELDISSCGKDILQAKKNLLEAIEINLIYRFPGAIRPVVIPMYDEVPVFVIRNNMRLIGMSTESYHQLLDSL